MWNKKNEQGYALLIVLFLVVFIMIVTVVFMRGSISNAKQEQKVDQNHLSYTAAEMGVDYYNALFTNQFLGVRQQIWNDNLIKFKNEIEAKGFTGNIKDLAVTFQGEIANEIIGELQRVNTSVVPSDVYYHKEKENFQISFSSSKEIQIVGNIVGDYHNGKDANLYMKLAFPIPSLLLEEEGDGSSNGGGGSFEFPNLRLSDLQIGTVDTVNKVQVSDEKMYASKKIYGMTNVLVRKKDDLHLSEIESNISSVDIWATGNMQSTKLYGNENVSIQVNGKFQTGNIQDNKVKLKIISFDDWTSSSNIYGNKDVTILTNGKFESGGQVDSNTGPLFIDATKSYSSGSLSKNKDVSVLTNGQFSTGLIELNTGKLTIKSDGKFQSGNLQYNDNVIIETRGGVQAKLIEGNKQRISIKTTGDFQSEKLQFNDNVNIEAKGNFQSDLIIGNKGSLVIKAIGDFQSKKIQNNKNGYIQTNGKFQANGVYGNENMEIYSKYDFESNDMIQDNTNLTIWTNDEFQTNGVIYGNKGVTIFSKNDFQSGKIQNNENLKIVTLNGFKADSIYLKENSTICVGEKFDVSGQIDIPSTSHIYLLQKTNKSNSRIEVLGKADWESKCGVSLSGGTGVNENTHWEPPVIAVKY
ncbi:hypothetical protein [Sporosarcina psychrophila]|uniref:hypothetical protein n=1 Tax=Sporosarcina psychrophila TaxID=1476 RepID=UPI00078C0F85|nr:hypothetical protein [Sporosarcina psychrophila]AMQ05972.1 hypothetical protein AZE41_08605 [Sporosarcina psychrophila]